MVKGIPQIRAQTFDANQARPYSRASWRKLAIVSKRARLRSGGFEMCLRLVNPATTGIATLSDMKPAEFEFTDRTDAGRQLGKILVAMELDHPLIYALPRG